MSRPTRILVVDDHAQHRKLVRWYLDEAGYDVAEAATLGEAQQAIADPKSFDAIIVDGTLPDGDGLELVAAVRADPQTEGKPVFVLSGRAEEEDRRRALSAGAAAYFVKPVDYATLMAAVASKLPEPPPR